MLEPGFVARHLSQDGRLGPDTARWLEVYRAWAGAFAAQAVLVAVTLFACRRRVEAHLAVLAPRALLVAGSLVLTLLVAEGVLRALGGDELLGRWQNTAAYQRHASTFRDSIREQIGPSGLRGHPLATPRRPGAARILVLGDSFVFGFGVDRLEDTFPAVLERELEAALGPGSVQVFNAGEPGANTADEVGNAAWLMPLLEPDLVLVGYYLNDIESEEVKERFFVGRRLLPLISDNVEEYSVLWRLVEERLAAWFTEAGGRSYTEHLGSLYASGFEEHRADLAAVVETVRAAGPAVAFVVFPLVQGFDGYPLPQVHEQLADAFAGLGVPLLDLLDVFDGRRADELVVAPFDPHLNATGLELAGRAAATFVVEQGLLSGN